MVHHSEKFDFALEVVEAADLALVDGFDCEAFSSCKAHTFANGAVVACTNHLWTDLIVLKDIGILAGDRKTAFAFDV